MWCAPDGHKSNDEICYNPLLNKTMDIKTIIERLRERHNIVALNEMQQLMAGTSARKIILLSPTGSGKTAAFAIRLLRELKPSDGTIQAVIMAPARELVLQIADVIRRSRQGLKPWHFMEATQWPTK